MHAVYNTNNPNNPNNPNNSDALTMNMNKHTAVVVIAHVVKPKTIISPSARFLFGFFRSKGRNCKRRESVA